MKHETENDLAFVGLGLGGNIGDPKQNLSLAVRTIADSPDISLIAVSNLYETPPWGDVNQPNFLNACLTATTSLSAQQLLEFCLSLETKMGRTRNKRWGPRTIDIDVLFYGDLTLNEEKLQLPHPRMTERAFVMVPLSEIAPLQVIKGGLVEEWATKLNDDDLKPMDHMSDWWMSGSD